MILKEIVFDDAMKPLDLNDVQMILTSMATDSYDFPNKLAETPEGTHKTRVHVSMIKTGGFHCGEELGWRAKFDGRYFKSNGIEWGQEFLGYSKLLINQEGSSD